MSLSDALAVPVSSDVGSSDPNVTSAPVASAPTGPAVPVDPTMAQPSPPVPTPPDAVAADQAASASQPQPVDDSAAVWGDAQPQVAQLAKQGRLASMIRGLLMGLEAGNPVRAVEGAAIGAAAPQMVSKAYANRQQEIQAAHDARLEGLKFQSARSALGIVEAGRDRAMLDALPDPLTQMHDQVAADQIAALAKNGAKPIVVPDQPGAGQAVMQELNNRYGYIPFVSMIHHGGLLYAYPVGGTGADYKSYVEMANETGQDPVSQQVWQGLSPEKQAENLHNLQSFFTSVPDAKHIDQAIQQTKLARATYAANTPEWHDNRAAVLKKYDDRLTFLANASAFYDAHNRQLLAQKRAAEQRANEAEQGKPSLFGDTTDLDPKQYGMMLRQYKPNRDALAKTEQSYAMFQSAARDARRALNGGPDMSGAQSVVTLFNAIGLSATPLKGMGFRINNNTVAEHANARSLGQGLYQKLLSLKAGDVITPQQVLDYTKIAGEARLNAYRSAISDARNVGLKADNFMPHGFGQQLDPNTRQIFLDAAGGDSGKAARAAKLYGWRF